LEYCKTLTGRRGLTPSIKPIPPEQFAQREKSLRDESTFKEHLEGVTDNSFGLVELGKLHAFQPNLNLEYIKRLKQKAPELNDLQGLLRFCLPLRDETQKTAHPVAFNSATNTLTMATENLDMRIIGNFQGEDPETGRRIFGFACGRGLSQMSVVAYKGIYMVKNGYHRAFALLEEGHKFMPCIVVKADNYQFTGAGGPGFFPFDLMLSDRSPLLSDFQSEAAVTHLRPLLRMVVSIHAEAQIITV
jgi:hypothetical protein